MKPNVVGVLAVSLLLAISLVERSDAAPQTRVLQPPAKAAGMSDQSIEGTWLANGDMVVAEAAERTRATSPRPFPFSVLKVLGQDGERPLGSFEGFFVNEVRSLGTHGGRERVELGGGVALKDGSRVYGKRVIEIGDGGRVETVWDSLRLPFEPGFEPSIQLSDDGQFWVAVAGVIRNRTMVGARVLAGGIESVIPKWTATIDQQGAAWIAHAPTAPTSDLEAVLLAPDLAAVLLRGRVFLVGPPGATIARPVLRPTLGRGRMLASFPKARLLVIYEEGTDALSCFQFEGDRAALAGVAAPDFVLDETTVGARSFEAIGATSAGLVLVAAQFGSSKPDLITVAISRQGRVRVVDRRVLPTSGKVLDTRLAADGRTVEWAELGRDHSRIMSRIAITSLAP